MSDRSRISRFLDLHYFTSTVIVLGFFAAACVVSWLGREESFRFMLMIAGACYVVAVLVAGYVRTVRDREQLRQTALVMNGQCAACGYDLRGCAAETTRCPECGDPILIAGANSPAAEGGEEKILTPSPGGSA
jgi:DNA-directed RNA polymerase subunit RPC12/RpoP